MPDLRDTLRHRLVPAVPVPSDRRGAIAEPALRTYAEWMARQDLGAVAVWAHTGRGPFLSDAQRTTVLCAWRDAAPHVPVICGVGAPRRLPLPADRGARTERVIEAAVRMTRLARDGGAAAVLVHPPTALRPLTDVEARAIELHAAVAEVGLPVLAFYLYEAAGGIAYSAATVRALLALDGVVGIKVATLDSVMTFQDLVPVVRDVPEALLVTGEDRFLGYSLALGADAALVGIGAACTDTSVRLLDAWYARRPEEFARWSTALDAFAAATFRPPMEGYVQRMLWALEDDGVIADGGPDPFGPVLDPAERESVCAAVRALRAA